MKLYDTMPINGMARFLTQTVAEGDLLPSATVWRFSGRFRLKRRTPKRPTLNVQDCLGVYKSCLYTKSQSHKRPFLRQAYRGCTNEIIHLLIFTYFATSRHLFS